MSTISSFVSTLNEFPNRFLHYADHIIEWKSFLYETPPYCIWPIIYTAAENRKLWSYTCHYKFRSYYSLISKKFLQTNCHTNQAWLVEHVRVIDRIGIAYFTHFSNVRTFRFYIFWHMASITHFSSTRCMQFQFNNLKYQIWMYHDNIHIWNVWQYNIMCRLNMIIEY